jgi:anti-sigma factor RsiW
VALPGQRLCPSCRREVERERARRLWARGGPDAGWAPVALFGLAAVGMGLLASAVHPAWTGSAAWLGGIAALVWLGRRP